MSLQASYSFELFKFYDLSHDLFKFSKTCGLAVRFKNAKHSLVLEHFFDLKHFNRHKLCRSPKCAPFTLHNYSSLSCSVLALSSAVNNLWNRSLIFHNFQGPTINSMTFQAWKTKFLNSMTFQVFHDLHEPSLTRNSSNVAGCHEDSIADNLLGNISREFLFTGIVRASVN